MAYIAINEKFPAPQEMPDELAEGTLFLAEKSISCKYPVALHGTPDQVFKTKNGRLVIVDVKTRLRAEAKPSEIMQMSVYRVILRAHKYDVAEYGYVRIMGYGQQQFVKVDLHPESTVIECRRRYVAIKQAGDFRCLSGNLKLCKSCGHRSVCHS